MLDHKNTKHSFVYVFCCFSVAVSSASVKQGAKQIKTVSTVECSSKSDIKFQFVRETVNKTRQTIAECETTMQTCFLKNQSLGRFFSVYYSGEGATLSVVLDVEETFGTYYCCEIFDSYNCIQLDVSLPVNNTPQTKSTEGKRVVWVCFMFCRSTLFMWKTERRCVIISSN